MPAEATVPVGAKCAQHPQMDALWMCQRCGAFMCQGCERRVRPEASPMCPTCWDLRNQHIKHQETNPKGWVVALAIGLGVFFTIVYIIAQMAR